MPRSEATASGKTNGASAVDEGLMFVAARGSGSMLLLHFAPEPFHRHFHSFKKPFQFDFSANLSFVQTDPRSLKFESIKAMFAIYQRDEFSIKVNFSR